MRTFGGILSECLDSVRMGETVEACLERYPKHAERLRPLLTLAARVQSAPAAEPRPWAQATAWDRVRLRAAELRSGKRPRGVRANHGMWLRPLAVAAALVLAIMGGGGATALASQSALPDSPLYRVKLLTEDARLWFVWDESQEAEILLDQSDERMDEILALARNGKPAGSNVFSAMENRHSRAENIIEDLNQSDPDRAPLETRLLDQSESQEDTLLALWDDVSPDGREDYTEVVAVLHNTRLKGSTELVLSPDDLSGGIRQINGEVRLVDGVWKIGDIEVTIDGRTIGGEGLADGATATGTFARTSSGRLQALSLFTIERPPAFVAGTIEEVRDDGFVIAGQFIRWDTKTIRPDLELGDIVEIEISNSPEGAVATTVNQLDRPEDGATSGPLTFVGSIESAVGPTEVVVSGLTFVIPQTAKIDANDGPAAQGSRALVEASYENGELTANSIVILGGDAGSDEVSVVGTYDGLREGQWLIGGIGVNPAAGIQPPADGSLVSAAVVRAGNTLDLQALFVVQAPEDEPLTRVQSTVQTLDGNHWDVGVGQVRVNDDARVSGEPEEGSRVIMWGRKSGEGVLQATYVLVLD
jgi:hypothetical protein